MRSAANLHREIRRRGYRYDHVAREIGVSPSRLSLALRGRRTSAAYAEILDRVAEWLSADEAAPERRRGLVTDAADAAATVSSAGSRCASSSTPTALHHRSPTSRRIT
ncbi:MAG: hypothetical protein ACYDDC_05860 [Thermoplasmataceae archaeon]